MSVHTKHLTFEEFVKNELNTLRFLSSQPYIIERFSELANHANNTFYNYKNYINKNFLSLINFEFSSSFDLEVEGKLKKITIDCQILPNFSLATYAFSVCKPEAESYDLLRKFHFDYALPIDGQEPKPVYHIQYCGKATPSLNKLNIDVEFLHPWLSVPRFSSTPINLALMLDMLFTEFRNQVTNDIIQRKEWRDHIKDHEDKILVPYYKEVNHFLSSSHKSTFLLRDFNYGK